MLGTENYFSMIEKHKRTRRKDMAVRVYCQPVGYDNTDIARDVGIKLLIN
jgi:hypothetical protein